METSLEEGNYRRGERRRTGGEGKAHPTGAWATEHPGRTKL